MRGVPQVISFPFRIGPDGSIATVAQGSDTEVEEQIAVAMLVRPGERVQVPSFGVSDPAFSGFLLGALQRHMLDFGPQVRVTAVSARLLGGPGGDREEVTVTWSWMNVTNQGVVTR